MQDGGREPRREVADAGETNHLRALGHLSANEVVYKHPIDLQHGTITLESDISRFTVQKVGTRSFRQSSEASEQTYYVRFNHGDEAAVPAPPGLGDLTVHLKVMFETLLEEIKKDYGVNGWVRVFIQHPKDNFKIVISPRIIRDFDVEDAMFHIERVLHSANFIPADEQLVVALGVVKSIRGQGRRALRNFEQDSKAKRSIVCIVNKGDNLCLPRAIVVAKACLDKDKAKGTSDFGIKSRFYDNIKRSRSALQRHEAFKLFHSAGLNLDEEGCVEHVPFYEKHLQVGITVISTEADIKPVYNGDDSFVDRIFLLHSFDKRTKTGHFDCVTSMKGLMCRQNYCNGCNKAYQNRGTHSCRSTCAICGFENCRVRQESATCQRCNRVCRSKQCLKRHQQGFENKKGRNIQALCKEKWLCPHCKVMIHDSPDSDRVKNHACGETFCSLCKQNFLNTHRCFMRIEREKKPTEKLIFFDFECMQESDIHQPNLVVCQTSCSMCEDFSVQDMLHCHSCGFRCDLCRIWNKAEKTFERNPCDNSRFCGKRRFHWRGNKTRDQFVSWLLTDQNQGAKVFAHNARSYDAYFVLAYLKDQGSKPNQIIMTGSKIMYMKIGGNLNIDLLDSLNFFPMPLSSLPKSFGLKELKKGFFPHFFNLEENQHVILDRLPPVHYYGPESMSLLKREEFLTWHALHREDTFDFQQELLDYCVSDVTILQEACLKFRNLVREQTKTEFQDEGIDPFNYITIASLCLGIFRARFLPEKYSILTQENSQKECSHGYLCNCSWIEGRKSSMGAPLEIRNSQGQWVSIPDDAVAACRFESSPIASTPSDEYGVKRNHSIISMQWLALEEKKWAAKGQMKHARNGGEYVVQYKNDKGIIRYALDGFLEEDKTGQKHAFEFYGCNWHGCPSCFPGNREEAIISGKTLTQVYRETKLREDRLKSMGFKLHIMWSCEFKDLREKNVDSVERMIESLNIVEPLRIRECYYGGRTNAIVLHKKMTSSEKGMYMDFTSLYPSVLKYNRFPVGHPQKLFNPTDWEYQLIPCQEALCCLGQHCLGFHCELPFFGMLKVTVLPPRNLLYPVLPLKVGTGKSLKLMFPLCYTCASEQSKSPCDCSDSKRQFTQSYCSPELNFAVSCGYRILHIHEVLQWNESEQYDRSKKTGGLFTKYVNSFLKMKQEASGFPPGVCDEAEQDAYIQEYENHEGIRLNKKSVNHNPGLRSLAKLALNSFYGKFGQRTDLRKTKFVTELSDLVRILLDRTKTVNDFNFLSENVMQVDYTPCDDFEPQASNSNVPIAAFCTTYARLELLGLLNKLDGRVLYHDTDSVIFTTREGDFVPKTGKYLGELTDELDCKSLGCKRSSCEGSHFIEEFVSCGPKNYAYVLNTGEGFCKVRGFSLNYANSRIINFEAMKAALFSWKRGDPNDLITVTAEIKRDKRDVQIVNKTVTKHYGVVFDKRRVLDDFSTVPYGYRIDLG